MPEGPEVRIIVDQLNHLLQNSELLSIEITSGRYSKKAPDNFTNFSSCLPLKIKEVKCKGKFIWFELDGWYIFNTLGMSGGWKLESEKHSHLTWLTNKATVYFTDMRNFGTFKFIKNKSELDKKLKELGTDALSPDYTLDYVKKVLGEKKSQTKTLAGILMNQKKFCGIGNYLKSEILYASKLSPHRTLESLTSDDITTLFHQSKKIIQASYDNGGGSAGDFSDLNKKKGSYKFKFQVYGRSLDPLGNKVKKETTQDKRTTHWVPTVQS